MSKTCHPDCDLGTNQDHPGYLGYRCLDKDGNTLPFPGERYPGELDYPEYVPERTDQAEWSDIIRATRLLATWWLEEKRWHPDWLLNLVMGKRNRKDPLGLNAAIKRVHARGDAYLKEKEERER